MKKLSLLFVLPMLLLASCGEEEKTTPKEPEQPTYEIHHYGEWVSNGVDGHKRTCADCGEVISEIHHFDKGFVSKAPTHLEDGEKIFTCIECGFSKTEPIEKNHNHVFDQAIVSEQTKLDVQQCGHASQYYLTCECGEISTTDTFEIGELLEHQYSGDLHINGSYKQTGYLGGDAFDISSISFQCYCEREGKLVDIPNKKIAFEYPNKGNAFDCLDTSIKAYMISNPSIKCDVPVTVEHATYAWITGKDNYAGFDIYECHLCHDVKKTYANTLKNIYYDFSAGTVPTLDLGSLQYKSITSIELGSYNLGTDPANLDFSSIISTGFKNYDANELKVTLLDNDNFTHVLKGNGYLIDKINYISTESQLEKLCVDSSKTEGLVNGPTDNGGSGSVLKGYYMLTNDIAVTSPWAKTPSWTKAFSGVFDGNGHSVTFKSTTSGIFSNVCYGIIRNTTFNDTYFDNTAQKSIISKELFESKIENCKFVCVGSNNPELKVEAANKGAVAYGKCCNNTFTNCLFDYNGIKVIALLCTAGGCTGNTFFASKFICDEYLCIASTQDMSTKFTTFAGLTIEGTLVEM